MIIQADFGAPGSCTNNKQQKIKGNPSDFQSRLAARSIDADGQGSAVIQDKKIELLNRFPALTEEKLESFIKKYDIESMDSHQMYQLAQQMIQDGVIPERPEESGLNMIAVYPRALYDAFLNGETFMNKGVVREGFHGCFTVNSGAGNLDYQYPRYGLKNLEYDLWMMRNQVEFFSSWYTDEERARQLQLTSSKNSFLELAKLLVDCRQQAGRTAQGIRS